MSQTAVVEGPSATIMESIQARLAQCEGLTKMPFKDTNASSNDSECLEVLMYLYVYILLHFVM